MNPLLRTRDLPSAGARHNLLRPSGRPLRGTRAKRGSGVFNPDCVAADRLALHLAAGTCRRQVAHSRYAGHE